LPSAQSYRLIETVRAAQPESKQGHVRLNDQAPSGMPSRTLPRPTSRCSVVAVQPRFGATLKRLLRAPVLLYDADLGWLLGRRFLCLTHVGRRSGRRYRTVLEVVGSDSKSGEVIVVAGLGRAAEWYRNVTANPDRVEVQIARERFRATHRVLAEQEAVDALGAYERRNRLAAPVIHRVLGWLVGWPYDGSESARRRLAGELPLVAFSRA
jgi:deazaflavin-dependent oxidoreductase (nitroreductase family)